MSWLKMAASEQQVVRCSDAGRPCIPGGARYRVVTRSWRRPRPSRYGRFAAKICSGFSSGLNCASLLPTAVSSGDTGWGCSSLRLRTCKEPIPSPSGESDGASTLTWPLPDCDAPGTMGPGGSRGRCWGPAGADTGAVLFLLRVLSRFFCGSPRRSPRVNFLPAAPASTSRIRERLRLSSPS